ncbi:MAG TPA: hypothetical protein VN931_02325 [Fibrobacteria bacterium]|nr:hypothetical protein [Fibrobacteria bacterium]
MRTVRLSALALSMFLAGCWDSGTGAKPASSSFAPYTGLVFSDKIVSRSAPGSFGPIFLSTNGLLVKDSTGTTYTFGGYFPYGELNLSTPWIDSEMFIDYESGSPTIAFWDLHDPHDAATAGPRKLIDLSQCPELPPRVFQAAKDSGFDPIEDGFILRVGRYAFLITQLYGSQDAISRAGVVLARMGDLSATGNGCGGFADLTASIGAKWIDLHGFQLGLGDTTHVRGKFLAAAPSSSGIFVSYWTQGDSATPLLDRDYLAFIDTLGSTRILDSSTISYYYSMWSFHGKTWTLPYQGTAVYALPSPTGAPIQVASASISGAVLPCFDVGGRCVLHSLDKLYLLDSTSFTSKPLDASGLEGDAITGVVQYRDTVFVSTLSGVFTKPLARFFDPVP